MLAQHHPQVVHRRLARLSPLALGQFGAQRARQITRYVEFVQEGERDLSVWEHLRGQIYLGSDAFIAGMQASLEDGAGAHRKIPRMQRRALAKSITYNRDTFEDTKS